MSKEHKDVFTEAINLQDKAAQDLNKQIRVIAGPGSGKSKVIAKRIMYLLERGIDPFSIYVLSFTNASVNDLRANIFKECQNIKGIESIKISTIHWPYECLKKQVD